MSSELPLCKYGISCFRRNPSHFKEFSHPDRNKPDEKADEKPAKNSQVAVTSPKLCVSKRKSSASHASEVSGNEPTTQVPFYLTKVRGVPEIFNEQCYSLKDILLENSANLIDSCQFNYMVDIPWLMEQYPMENRGKPLLIICGSRNSDIASLRHEASRFPNISIGLAPIPDAYGTHHTKMFILHYVSGVKIVIHTANLVVQDWDQKTQGLYISPLLPLIPSNSANPGDSPTHFKRDLLEYLRSYRLKPLDSWLKLLENCDMTSAKVFIISSIPGRHTQGELHKWGHMKLRKVLSDEFEASVDHNQLVGQFSSIGSLGPSAEKWLTSEFLTSLSGSGDNSLKQPTKKAKTIKSTANLSLVFPSVDDVRCSLEGYPAGGSIPYGSETAKKQLWLERLLCRWIADHIDRTTASPHIKSYLRCSANFKDVSWFLLTSANLSKAAWGALEKSETQLFIRAYELGVLFLPKFVTGQDSFLSSVIPFDLPPTPYGPNDKPWLWDVPHVNKPDSHGNVWRPS